MFSAINPDHAFWAATYRHVRGCVSLIGRLPFILGGKYGRKSMKSRRLGTVEASELLISDLYLSLRRVINGWALVTSQTAQARMGYVGQHLVSVVTGYSGGKSGARGRDLLLPGEEHAEIKTCYRVDQLGSCNACRSRVAGVEMACGDCGSGDIKRNDDSKWLIGIRNDDEFATILDPTSYYLVLFDFENAAVRQNIRASIWRVDPKCPGFSLCMVDYYLNIQANSASKAPFNLWPLMLKFYLMRPVLIYRSLISVDDTIQTVLFPDRDEEIAESVFPLTAHAQSTNLSANKIGLIARRLGVADDSRQNKRQRLQRIDEFANAEGYGAGQLADLVAIELYRDGVAPHLDGLPTGVRDWLPDFD